MADPIKPAAPASKAPIAHTGAKESQSPPHETEARPPNPTVRGKLVNPEPAAPKTFSNPYEPPKRVR